MIENIIEEGGSQLVRRQEPPSFNRVVVLNRTHYIPYEGDGFTAEAKYTYNIETEEQPYIRENRRPKNLAGKEWTRVDVGWLQQDCGLVVVKNDEGVFYQVILSDEDKIEKKIIEVGHPDNKVNFFIYPQDTINLRPTHLENLMIRCINGDAKYTIYAIPK